MRDEGIASSLSHVPFLVTKLQFGHAYPRSSSFGKPKQQTANHNDQCSSSQTRGFPPLLDTAFYADLWPRRPVFRLRWVLPTSQEHSHLFVSCSTATKFRQELRARARGISPVVHASPEGTTRKRSHTCVRLLQCFLNSISRVLKPDYSAPEASATSSSLSATSATTSCSAAVSLSLQQAFSQSP